MGHKCAGVSMVVRLSIGGTAGPGLISVANPNAPSCFVSVSQDDGGTYSYGPSIFTPLGPLTGPGVAVAFDTVGRFHSTSRSMSRYLRSTMGIGGLSLPFSHTKMLGWLRRWSS